MAVHQIHSPSTNKSDFPAHLAAAQHLASGRLDVPDFLFHAAVAPLFLIFHRLGAAATLVTTACQAGLTWLVFERLRQAFHEQNPAALRNAGLATLALVIAGPISVFTFPNLMFGYLTPTTYHNPTIIAAKPLAVAEFVLLDRLLLSAPQAAGAVAPATLAGLAAIAFLATLAKPAYAIAALPALGVWMLVFRRTIPWPRFWVVTSCIAAGSVAVIAWQYVFLFGDRASGSGVAWAPLLVAHEFEPDNRRLAVKALLSLAFPLTVVLTDFRATGRDRALVFCWIAVGVSAACYYLFTETGPRYWHGNLGWVVLVAVFMLFFQSLIHLLRRAGSGLPARARQGSFAVFALHVVSGAVWYVAMFDAFPVCSQLRFGWCW